MRPLLVGDCNVAWELLEPYRYAHTKAGQLRSGESLNVAVHKLTVSMPPNVFRDLSLLGASDGVRARLDLECAANVDCARLAVQSIHAALQSISLPAKKIVPMLAVTRASQSCQTNP